MLTLKKILTYIVNRHDVQNIHPNLQTEQPNWISE